MSGIVIAAKKKLALSKENIVFSSDDSFNTDNSFNSSVENENNDDYKNTFFHLKEQMNQLFIANPELQDNLRFDTFNPNENDDEDLNRMKIQNAPPAGSSAAHHGPHSAVPKPQYVTEESKQEQLKKLKEKEQKSKSQMWNSLSKNIVRNAHIQNQIPTLETVNQRLNIYKKEITRVDYIELMTKELTPAEKANGEGLNADGTNAGGSASISGGQQSHQPNGSSKKSKYQQGDSSDDESMLQNNGEMEYFSFKKRMQMKAKELRIKQEQLKAEKISAKRRSGYISRPVQLLETKQDSVESSQGLMPTKLLTEHRGSLLITTHGPGGIRRSISQKGGVTTTMTATVSPTRASKQERGSILLKMTQRESILTGGAAGSKVMFGIDDMQHTMESMRHLGVNSSGGTAAAGNTTSAGVGASTAAGAGAVHFDESSQYKSKIGKALFLAMQQSKGDKEIFRKSVQSTLRDYTKSKASILKAKKFPPQLPKFTQDDNAFLNHLLPDFSISVTNGSTRNDPFEDIKDFHPAPHSIEDELIGAVDKIAQGKILNVWKQQSTH